MHQCYRGGKKVGLKLNIQKTKIMASGLITLWQIDGETMETVRNYFGGGSKITADGDCSHEIKRCLLLGRKVSFNFMAEITICSDFGAQQKESLTLFLLFAHLFAIK